MLPVVKAALIALVVVATSCSTASAGHLCKAHSGSYTLKLAPSGGGCPAYPDQTIVPTQGVSPTGCRDTSYDSGDLCTTTIAGTCKLADGSSWTETGSLSWADDGTGSGTMTLTSIVDAGSPSSCGFNVTLTPVK